MTWILVSWLYGQFLTQGHSKVNSRLLGDPDIKMTDDFAIAMSTNPLVLGFIALRSIISSMSYKGHFVTST